MQRNVGFSPKHEAEWGEPDSPVDVGVYGKRDGSQPLRPLFLLQPSCYCSQELLQRTTLPLDLAIGARIVGGRWFMPDI